MKKRWGIIVFIIIIKALSVFAQSPCNISTPTFNVSLVSSTTAVWTSPSVTRAGACCSGTISDCILFNVSVHPNSGGIILEIISGSIPSGSMIYTTGCSQAVVAVGQQMCLNGQGPHTIFFCKPGNNANTYRITSFPKPNLIAPEVKINQNCSASIWVEGYTPASIQWTSVFPGTIGQYNSYLSCTTCASPSVTPGINPPAYVDYQVSGIPISTCNLVYNMTIRVYVNSAISFSINPQFPVLCYGSSTIDLNAVASGGSPPYNYLWNTGATTSSILAGPGSYSCLLTDQSICPSTSENATVSINPAPITVNAGADIEICYNAVNTPLNGSVSIASGGIWSGGQGTFLPSASSLNAVYYPTETEKLSDSLMLFLQSTGNGLCEPVTDTLNIYFFQKPNTSNILHY